MQLFSRKHLVKLLVIRENRLQFNFGLVPGNEQHFEAKALRFRLRDGTLNLVISKANVLPVYFVHIGFGVVLTQ